MSVGFSFQADIANTSSLAHLITGKALKALSDGGVDFYSVAASIWLGKQVPVRRSLESTVHSHIASRGGIQSVLSKALSIGWGHSGLAIEMTRTRAGTNALLLIGALAAGSSHFMAAQCLSELLALSGCEADKLPNVDVLRHMVSYLAPYVHDLGFSRVMEHINTTAQYATRKEKVSFAYYCLTTMGMAPVVAGTIKQLILTAQRNETIYMVIRVRGSWFAAFASHILGMATELHLHDTVIWASAGDQGKVIFQVGDAPSSTSSLQVTSGAKIAIIDPPTTDEGGERVMMDYLLGDALGAILAQEPDVTESIRQGVHRGVAYEAFHLLSDMDIGLWNPGEKFLARPGTGQFEARLALKQTLGILGIADAVVEDAHTQPRMENALRDHMQDHPAWAGLSCLGSATLAEVMAGCPVHGGERTRDIAEVDPNISCTCATLGRLIHGFASTALALMHCRFDPSDIRVKEDVVKGDFEPFWASSLGWGQKFIKRYILTHVHRLLSGGESVTEQTLADLPTDKHVLGLSAGAYTVYYTCILQNDCYDDLGRCISIQTGRASLNGTFRSIISEVGQRAPYSQTGNYQPPSTIAAGSFIEPYYCPSETRSHLVATLGEKTITLQASVGPTRDHAYPILFEECVSSLLGAWSVPRCSHHRDAPCRISDDQSVVAMGFLPYDERDLHRKKTVSVFALRGNRLEQLFTYGFLRNSFDKRVIQLHACLGCCIRISSATDGYSYVVIAG